MNLFPWCHLLCINPQLESSQAMSECDVSKRFRRKDDQGRKNELNLVPGYKERKTVDAERPPKREHRV